jgi:DNA polymerase-3 subunit beta
MMKLQAPLKDLQDVVKIVRAVVDQKNFMPVLQCLRLEALDGALTVRGTDLDVDLTLRMGAAVSEPGVAVVDARQLADALKSAGKGGFVDLAVDESAPSLTALMVRAGSYCCTLPGMASDVFPEERVSIPVGHGLVASGLRGMLDRMVFCHEREGSRLNLQGVYAHAVGSQTLRLVATDGHRLALTEHTFPAPVGIGADGVILSAVALTVIRDVLRAAPDVPAVAWGFSLEEATISMGTRGHMVVRLVEGEFPDYRQVIPTESSRTVRVKGKALADALKRAGAPSPAPEYGVKLTAAPGQLTVTTRATERGHVVEQVPIELEGEPFEMALNSRYLLDALSTIRTCDVELRFGETFDLDPVTVRSPGAEGFLAVVMPLKM